MFLVGLTGGIATGKSAVSRLLLNSGVEVIDADLIARQVVEPGKRAWLKIRDEFGPDVFHEDDSLNREKLGQIIFSSPEKRKKLNQITHPDISSAILWQLLLSFLCRRQFVVLDVPLLFSASLGSFARKFLLNRVVVVSCAAETQKRRLMSRNGLTEEEAESRILAQMSLSDQEALADNLLWNEGSEEELGAKVEELVLDLRASPAHWKFRTFFIGLVGAVLVLLVHLLF